MAKKKEALKVIDIPPPVTGGGGLIQQVVETAPPIQGQIPKPTNLALVATSIIRSSQAPMVAVDVEWRGPTSAYPEAYVVEYTKSTFDTAVRQRANQQNARLLLDTSTTYYIRVQSVYRNVVSDWSNTLTVVTPADTTPPSDVTSVSATFVNGDVVVTWTEPGPTNETYKDARIRIWNPGKTILYGTYHTRGGTFIWTEAENLRLISGGVTSVAVDVTSRGWNNVYGSVVNTTATMSAPTAPTSLTTDFTTGDLVVSWVNPTGIPYRDIEVKIYESSSKITNYKTYYLSGNTITFSKEDNFNATSNNPDTVLYIEVKTRGWLGLLSTAASATATHISPSPVSNLFAEFVAGDFIVTWDNPAGAFKDVEIKIYESGSKITNYKTYYILGNNVIFTQSDNYAVNGSTPDTSMFVEVKVRSWLGLLSGSSSYTATLVAPNPVTVVNTDFTTGNLEIRWTNPTNAPYRDVEVKLYESASKVTNYKTYYSNTNRITFTKEDNFAAVAAAGGVGADTAVYYEIIVRSWLGVVSSTVTGTATHSAPPPVTSVISNFDTGDLEISWTNPATTFKDVEVKLYESAGKAINYKTYYIQGNRVKFTVEDNFNATAGVGDTSIYYEIKVRSWLEALSTAVSATVTHQAPDPITSATEDFTTGDLDIRWVNPSTPFKDIEIKIYNDSGKGVTYKTYYIQGNRIVFTVEDNFAATGNNPDPSVYYEIKARSWLNLTSTAVGDTVTKALPSAPANVVHTWTGDNGTFPADLKIQWDRQNHVIEYKIVINSTYIYTTNSPLFEYLYAMNVNDVGALGDPSLSIAIQARDRLLQLSTATIITPTNAAPPGSSVISIDTQPGFSTIGAFLTLTSSIKDLNHFIFELHDGASVVQTLLTNSQVVSFEGVDSGTYTVRVKAVDLFGQQGAQVTSTSFTIDALTIEELRAEAKYTDSQGRSSPTLDVLKDDLNGSTINYTNTPAGVWRWTLLKRPLIDRYGVVTYIAPDNTEVYIGVSTDDITYTWFSGTTTHIGSNRHILTEKASEASAKTDKITCTANIRYTFELPELIDARFIKLGHRSNNAGNYLISEFYGRRLVQSDDIQAENIATINLVAGAVTADKISVTNLAAVHTSTGTLVVNNGGYIRSGQTAYDTGTGYFIGTDMGGTGIFSIGDANKKLTWDGANLYLLGAFIIRTATTAQKVEITSTGLKGYNSSGVVQVQIDTSDGKLRAAGGAVILDSTGVSITSGGNIRSGQTAYDTGTGFYLGNDSGTPKFSVGNASGDKLTWNGTVMSVTGQFNLSGVATIGTSGGLYQGTGTFATPTTGLKLFNSGGVGKLSTYNGGTEQVTFDTDGKLKAGGGDVILDASGLTINASTDAGDLYRSGINAVKFVNPATGVGRFVWTTYHSTGFLISSIGTFSGGSAAAFPSLPSSTSDQHVELWVEANAGVTSKHAQLHIKAVGTATSNYIRLSVSGTYPSGFSGTELYLRYNSHTTVGYLYSTKGLNIGNDSDPGAGTLGSEQLVTQSTNSTKHIFTDSNAYSNGTTRTINIHFRASNPDSSFSNNSASIVVNITPQTGITVPKSTISLYTSENTEGYKERLKVDEFGTTLLYTIANDKLILTDTNTYSNGVARTVNLLFKARNPDSSLTQTSAAIVATITANTGITTPQSTLSFYTKDNSIGYGERVRIETAGNLNAYFGINVGSASGAGTGQIKSSSGIFVGSTDAGGSGSGSNDIRTSGNNQLTIGSTDAYNTPPKARITGVTKYTSGGVYTNGSFIEFGKENTTDGNYGYYLAIGIRTNGSASGVVSTFTSTGSFLHGRSSGLTGYGDADFNARVRADTFETAAGIKLKFVGGYTATPLTIVGYYTVNIDGTDRKVAIVA